MGNFNRGFTFAAGSAAGYQLGRDLYSGAKGLVRGRKTVTKRPARVSPRTVYYPMYRPLPSFDVKRILTDVPFTTYGQNIQHYYALGQVAQGTDINQRLRQIIHPISADIDMVFKNDLGFFQVCRWALIQPKSNRDISGTNMNNEFFRGANTIRAVDYDQVFKGSHKMSYPINRDIYKVYAEGAFEQGGTNVADGNAYTRSGLARLRRKVYFPRGTKIVYEGPTSADDQTAPIFVWWWVRPETNSITVNEGAGFGPLKAGGHIILAFKEML